MKALRSCIPLQIPLTVHLNCFLFSFSLLNLANLYLKTDLISYQSNLRGLSNEIEIQWSWQEAEYGALIQQRNSWYKKPCLTSVIELENSLTIFSNKVVWKWTHLPLEISPVSAGNSFTVSFLLSTLEVSSTAKPSRSHHKAPSSSVSFHKRLRFGAQLSLRWFDNYCHVRQNQINALWPGVVNYIDCPASYRTYQKGRFYGRLYFIFRYSIAFFHP